MDLPDLSYDNARGLPTSPIPSLRRGVSTSSELGPSGQSHVLRAHQKPPAVEAVLPASPGTVHREGAPVADDPDADDDDDGGRATPQDGTAICFLRISRTK